MKIRKFEDLPIWKKALKLTREIYDLTNQSKFNKDFKLRDQIRGAVISISSNIVEGFEKNNNNEFIRFLKIAKGSTGEVRNQLYVALSIDYVTQTEFDQANKEFEDLAGQIGGFIVYLQKCRTNNQFTKK